MEYTYTWFYRKIQEVSAVYFSKYVLKVKCSTVKFPGKQDILD